MTERDALPAGSRWLEVKTGRTITILGSGVVGPWWRYDDDPTATPWYCCVEDFFVWGRFRRLT